MTLTETITISRVDHAYIRLDCEPSTLQEISEAFTFKVPGSEFMPAVRNRLWDGKIRLVNNMTRTVYAGLYTHVADFCRSRGYEVIDDSDFSQAELSIAETKQFLEGLNLPEKVKPRDYQLKAFIHAIRNKRSILLSPTASGKSLIIYLITRYYNAKTLIVVPTISLVHQLEGDFRDYGHGQELAGDRNGSSQPGNRDQGTGKAARRGADSAAGSVASGTGIHKIYAGQDRETEAQVTITTWQSVYKQPKGWFDQFEVIIGDEVHLFKAKSLTTIMTNLTKTSYRIGLTGTLDGTQTHKLVLEGLFGPVYKVVSTTELMEQKHISDLKIKCIVLGYSDAEKKQLKDYKYHDEMDFLCGHPARNKFIKNLAVSLNGNTLILFQYVEKHGKILYDLLKNEDRKVFYVHGGVDGDEREAIRSIVSSETNAIIVASYGTFSTGINIPNISNLVFASPSKSKIRNLQSIGRGLRKADGKEVATLFDIADDLTWKSARNYTLDHFAERVKIYNEEGFEYKLYSVRLNQ